MIILGLDPGTKLCGYCVLDTDKMSWLAYGKHPTDITNLTQLANVYDTAVCVMERLEGYAFDQFRIPGIIDTARVEGRLEVILGDRLIMSVTAKTWRKYLTGKGTASNKMIKDKLVGRFPNLPKTNEHVRDAMGLSVYCMDYLYTKGAQ